MKSNEIYELKVMVSNLEKRVAELEKKSYLPNVVYGPAPYWFNPDFKMPPVNAVGFPVP